jgi:ABC-2 type transport system permease protein
VGYERLRPLDTYAFWYARAIARRTATPLLRAVPMIVTAGILLRLAGLRTWSLSPPSGTSAGLLFAASMVLVVALSAAMATLADMMTVATLSERGVNTVTGPLVIVLSGSLIPLPLLPDWLQGMLAAQPFAGLVDIPFRIYAGHLAGLRALLSLTRQALWVIALVLVGRWLMARIMARLETQGG